VVSSLFSPLLRRPLLCLTLAWLAGMLLAGSLPIPWAGWLLAAGILLAAWVLTARGETQFAGLLLLPTLLCLGAARQAWHAQPLRPADLRYLPAGPVILLGYPEGAATETGAGWHGAFRLLAIEAHGQRRPAAGLLYLSGRTDPPLGGNYYRVTGQVRSVDAPGNPVGFSLRAYLLEHHYTYAVRAHTLTLLPGRAPTPWPARWRETLQRRLAATMPGSYPDLYAQLLTSVLLGIHGAALPDEFTHQFRRAGIIHLMVVSGSQVALLSSFLLFPLWFIPRGRAGSTYPVLRVVMLALALPGLGLYLALADRGPSVDRALLMVLLTMLAVFLGFSPLARYRAFHPDGLTLLALAALVITAANPALLGNPGLQLSFAAVLGLLTITTPLRRLLEIPLGKAAIWPAATLGAQLLTVPVLAWHFGVIPVLAVVTNLVAVPAVALLMPLGLCALCCALVCPPLALAVNYLNLGLLHGLLAVGQATAAIPWAEWHWVVRSPLVIIAYLLGVAVATRLLASWADRAAERWPIAAGREPAMW